MVGGREIQRRNLSGRLAVGGEFLFIVVDLEVEFPAFNKTRCGSLLSDLSEDFGWLELDS